MSHYQDPPSPVEDDLGVDDFDLKQDHLLGPSPPPPPQHHHQHHSDLSSSLVDAYIPENVKLEDSHDHHILQDDHHDDDDVDDDDQDVVAMLDEERDDKTAAVKAEDDDNDNDNNASDENESPMLTAVSSPLLASPQQQQRLQQEPQSVASVASASSVTATPSPKRKKRERNNLRKAPQAPKRFKSSYICFFTSKQSEIKERLGSTATVSQVSKESAQMWKKLTPDEKAYWDDVAAKDKERYMEEKANYTGPWQVANKRQKKDKSAPKRPMSAFLYFSQGRRKEIKEKHPYFKNTEISRVLGEMWRNSSEEERGPFIELEKVERVKYKQAMAQWKVEFAKKKEVERLEQVEQMKQKQEAMQMQGEQIRAHQHAMQVAAHQQYDGAVARAAAVAAADADAADQAKHGMQRHHHQQHQHQQAYHPMHHYPYMPPHHAAYAQFIPPGYPSMYRKFDILCCRQDIVLLILFFPTLTHLLIIRFHRSCGLLPHCSGLSLRGDGFSRETQPHGLRHAAALWNAPTAAPTPATSYGGRIHVPSTSQCLPAKSTSFNVEFSRFGRCCYVSWHGL